MDCLKKSENVNVSQNLLQRFDSYLRGRGYPTRTTVRYLSIAERILKGYTELNEKVDGISLIDLSANATWSHTGLLETRAVRAVFRHLQRIYREIQPPSAEENLTPIQRELSAFDEHLATLCGLASVTRGKRVKCIDHFLRQQFGAGSLIFQDINPVGLMHYVAHQSRGHSPGTGAGIATSVRSYLKFLQYRGDVDPRLVLVVPSPPCRRLKDYPVTMSESQIASFTNAFDHTRPDGKRDYAMMLLMLYMGLRSGEVAKLTLSDIDWRRSVVSLNRGKGPANRELPLSKLCGDALADYLRHGRPSCTTRRVFVRHTTPIGSDLTSENVRGAMRRGYARAELPQEWTGTHILRHTAATRMLNNGASLKQIADVLGHQSIDTTSIYTKVDTTSLEPVCQPWPGTRS